MTNFSLIATAVLLALSSTVVAQQPQSVAKQQDLQAVLERSSQDLQKQLAESLVELDRVMQQVAEEKVPLGRTLRELEAELSQLRQSAADRTRQLDAGSQALGNLTAEQKRKQDEQNYLGNVFGEFVRNFESSLHIAEVQLYDDVIAAAKLAADDRTMMPKDLFVVQANVVTRSIQRLQDCLGGNRFDGRAVGADGVLTNGTFALVGPIAVFRGKDGVAVGTVDAKLGSLEPSVTSFSQPEQAAEAAAFVASGKGALPVDPTLGSAHKVAATEETLVEHFLKGGAVMWPILALAIAALLVTLWKWLSLSLIRRPTRRQLKSLFESLREKDYDRAKSLTSELKGPIGEMLGAGVGSLQESRELLEEVMFERILTAKLRIQSMLPFLAISASSAPLLGLLGTVTGIIETFKQITIYGSGDVASLSGGISEALITTEYGLIVAIPSLLLHSFLSRKARGLVSEMETLAVQFTNVTGVGGGSASTGADLDGGATQPAQIRMQIREVLGEILGPVLDDDGGAASARAR